MFRRTNYEGHKVEKREGGDMEMIVDALLKLSNHSIDKFTLVIQLFKFNASSKKA